jgi:flagellar biosynthesis protein FlhB
MVDASLLAAGELPALLASWASALVALTALCLVTDIAFARARFFASLWLSPREYLDDQRATFGAPELRRARAAVRTSLRSRARGPASTARAQS